MRKRQAGWAFSENSGDGVRHHGGKWNFVPATALKDMQLHKGDLPKSDLPRSDLQMNRNVLILAVAVLCVAVGALGYKLYEDQREPKGVQLNIGSQGISVEKK